MSETQATARHPERYCHRCGGPNVQWAAPSPIWNQVMRGGDINGPEAWDGIVCLSCFAQAAEEAGIASGWRLTAEQVHVPVQTTTPSGRVWSDEAFLFVEQPIRSEQ